MWTSSLRLRGGALGTGACLAALACAANGWAAGGTPMPAPDDPPPAYQTSTVKTSAPTTAPTAPRAKRVAESAPSGADARRPGLRSVDHDGEGSHREAGRGSRARSLSGRGVAHRPPGVPRHRRVRVRVAPCARRLPPLARRSLRRVRRRSRKRSRSKAQQKTAVTQGEADGGPSRRPAPGRHRGSVCRSERSPPARPAVTAWREGCSSPQRSSSRRQPAAASCSVSQLVRQRGTHESRQDRVPALALAAGAATLPGEARALDPPTASCNGGGCGGWFRSSVTVSWSYNGSGVTGTSGCGAATIGDDTSGARSRAR